MVGTNIRGNDNEYNVLGLSSEHNYHDMLHLIEWLLFLDMLADEKKRIHFRRLVGPGRVADIRTKEQRT